MQNCFCCDRINFRQGSVSDIFLSLGSHAICISVAHVSKSVSRYHMHQCAMSTKGNILFPLPPKVCHDITLARNLHFCRTRIKKCVTISHASMCHVNKRKHSFPSPAKSVSRYHARTQFAFLSHTHQKVCHDITCINVPC